MASHSDSDEFFRRTLIQLKFIEKYKYILSEQAGYEISAEMATKKWIDNKLAANFAKHYDNLVTTQTFDIEQLFILVMK